MHSVEVSHNIFRSLTKSVGDTELVFYSPFEPRILLKDAFDIAQVHLGALGMESLLRTSGDTFVTGDLDGNGARHRLECETLGTMSIGCNWFETYESWKVPVEPPKRVAVAILCPDCEDGKNDARMLGNIKRGLRCSGVGHLAAEITKRIADRKSAIGILVILNADISNEKSIQNGFLSLFFAQLQCLGLSDPSPDDLNPESQPK